MNMKKCCVFTRKCNFIAWPQEFSLGIETTIGVYAIAITLMKVLCAYSDDEKQIGFYVRNSRELATGIGIWLKESS